MVSMDGKNIVIIGTGGFGREVLWAATSDPELLWVDGYYFVDDNPETHGEFVCDFPVIGRIEDVPDKFLPGEVSFVCGVGSPSLRESFVGRVSMLPPGYENFVVVKHPSVNLSKFVSVGEGSVLCAGSNITTQVSIGNHVNVNLDCTIGHDCTIEDYVNLSPGVHISGYCKLARGCDIGTGANIIPGVTVGEGAVVGAGACVTKDIPPHTLAVGVPAVVKKTLK